MTLKQRIEAQTLRERAEAAAEKYSYNTYEGFLRGKADATAGYLLGIRDPLVLQMREALEISRKHFSTIEAIGYLQNHVNFDKIEEALKAFDEGMK